MIFDEERQFLSNAEYPQARKYVILSLQRIIAFYFT